MRILGIETTCDETAAAVLEDGRRLLSNKVFSQIGLHKKYNGVVPELASRAHTEKIAEVIGAALSYPGSGYESGGALSAGSNPPVDAVAFARGPGLPGALLVGKVAAHAVGEMFGVPVIGVNHLEGHIFACELRSDSSAAPLEYPLVALTVSGGHTELWLMRGPGLYRVLGRTRDDAAGEAFDKIAKLLDLGYPGGPVVEKYAGSAVKRDIEFPRPLLPGTWDFSFSGLKTAVSYYLRDCKRRDPAGICSAFQTAVVETLAVKAVKAARHFGVKHIAVGGGVSANSALRRTLAERAARHGITARFVERRFCTDNGAMIALAAHKKLSAAICRDRSVRVNPDLRGRSWAL
ncbi:MAG: tRNA (adenosine(37)-N6)-threonylcarbamoyltransferase complex transferase subunit TsaD [Elusimicrobiaceae bacterium]|nr:tRNA (adenosine(37)-N6)-threonylcarbamoyltransferase complex transferase subunit TsaD [Elusimicrobiaceae bacterium]